jgi:phosphate-selective porin OprO/OprP
MALMLATIAFLGTSVAVWAQEIQALPAATGQYVAPTPAQQGGDALTLDEIQARFEQQDREIRQLQAQLAGAQQAPPAATAAYADPVGANAALATTAGSAPSETVVGSDTSIKARFFNGAGIMFETPNKDFTMHLGGWAQWDNVWWGQSNGMAANPTAQAANQGVASGGVGQLEDGDYFRRIRIVMEGTFYETYEYRWNYAPENNSFSTIGLDEFWVGVNKVPVIGTMRVGHVKTPMGLEGDMTSSSRCMTFMERSSYSEAIELNQNFGTGLWFGNTYLDDERGTWSAAIFRPDNQNSGDFFGDDQAGLQARITALPLYEDEGRHLLHLGVSGGWRDGINAAPGGANYVDLRARPELRDDDPGSGGLPNADSNRMIDTLKINCNEEYLLGLEALYIRGPFSLQAEYGWNFLDNAQITVGTPKPIANYIFDGGYLQAAYTLTGENRAYDKKGGGLSRYYFGGQGPYENAFLVRDADGNLCSGHGAVELACRYSYVNLNDGTGAAFVNGGIMQGVSVGLNWYLNANLTVNTEWVYDFRYDLPGNGANPGATTVVGDTSAFGTRVQLSF